jgi:hypothetical protein
VSKTRGKLPFVGFAARGCRIGRGISIVSSNPHPRRRAMKKLIVLLAVLASGVVVDASGRSESTGDAIVSQRDAAGPTATAMAALRRACTSSSREAAANWCDLAFTQ